MSIAKYAMTHKTVVNFILVITLLGGILAFPRLGKLEDAPFIIKRAVLTTMYPGASPQEVEELVTEVIEREVQSARGVDYIKSESWAGHSIIYVEMFPTLKPDEIPQIWDELRRKVKKAQVKLPPGCSTIDVNDDFGDVFGIYYGLMADEGFSNRDLFDYGNFIKRELVTIPDAAKVELFGVQSRVINIKIMPEKLRYIGANLNQVITTLQAQNKIINTADIQVTPTNIRATASGTFQSIEEIENLIISTKGNYQYRVKDFAEVTEGYLDPPITLMRMNGRKAIGIGISTRDGGNAITLGEEIKNRLDRLQKQLPVGISIEGIYFQDRVAVKANNDFIKNLFISISIVIFIILLAMGARAGALIGSSLLFSILGTLVIMLIIGIELHRTSLAAIIVAMGMLVDNAIVVTDNAMVSMKRGVPKITSLIQGASVPQWGLLGATFIAIVSFLPLYLAPNSTAEVIAPLFLVLAISLSLSWVFALIQTTVYGNFILKEPKEVTGQDPYDKPFYRKFKTFIEKAIDYKWITLGAILGIFFITLSLFRFVEQSFFPFINKPYFKVDYFLPQGTSIYETENQMMEIEDFLLADERVKNVSITIGKTPLRYYLASNNVSPRSNFANILVEAVDDDMALEVYEKLREHLNVNYPDAQTIFFRFKVSPVPDAILEATFLGPDPEVLRELSEKAKEIMLQDPLVQNVRDGWGNKTLSWGPIYSQDRGQQAGVLRDEVALTVKTITDGVPVGDYRERDESMPILLKMNIPRNPDLINLGGLQVFNRMKNVVPLDQVVEGYELKWENPVIKRYNRQRALAAQCDPIDGVENPEVEARLMPKINAIELPEGYSIFWDGIYKSQTDSQNAIGGKVPLMFFLIILVLVVLFNSMKKTFVIFLVLPLILIGVVLGFLITGQSMGFFALLGILGLIGMVTKNAIVLMDQINIEIEENHKEPYQAVVDSALSRAMPVSMAAATTIMGMLPLLPDPMFGGMAATIMGGLAVATILTLVIVPVFYAIFFKLPKGGGTPKDNEAN